MASPRGKRGLDQPKWHRFASLAAVVTAATWAAVLLSTITALGQQSGEKVLPPGLMSQTAPVVIDGRTLFRVRGVTSYPAALRAREIRDRIIVVAADPSRPVDTIRVVKETDRSRIVAGDFYLMAVFDGDANLEGVRREVLAEVDTRVIKNAVTAYRRERAPDQLMRDGLAAGAATLAVALMLWLILRLTRVITSRLERRYRRIAERLEEESFEIIRAQSVSALTRGALTVLSALVTASVVYVYLHTVLSLFPWTRGFADRILGAVLSPVSSGAAKILATLPKLIILALIVVATRYLLKVMRLFFSAVEHGRIRLASFEPEWAEPTHKIARILIIVFAIVVSYPYIPGSGTEAFKGITIFFGLLFSLGSSSLIANLIAGYTMTYRRAFHGGDRIAIGDLIGDVTKVRLMVTHLRSLKNEEVVIPNSAILNTHVINYSALAREHGLVLHTMVGIGYEVPWRQVEAMLLMAAQRTEGLLREPQPYVLQKSLGDFAVNYELNVFCDRPLQMYELYAALHRSILDVFNEFGIQIMTPAYVSDPAQPKLVPKPHWFDAPARDASESGDLPRIEPDRTRNSA